MAATRKSFTFVLRPIESVPAKSNPHTYGHYFNFFTKECTDKASRAHVYIEFDDN